MVCVSVAAVLRIILLFFKLGLAGRGGTFILFFVFADRA